MNCIEVPIFLKVNITNSLSTQAGSYFAYLLDAEVTNNAGGSAADFENNYNNDDFNKFDVGISAGSGFGFDSFALGFRYNYGF